MVVYAVNIIEANELVGGFSEYCEYKFTSMSELENTTKNPTSTLPAN